MSYEGNFRFGYKGFHIIRTSSDRDNERWLVYWPTNNQDFNFHPTQGAARREIDALRLRRDNYPRKP